MSGPRRKAPPGEHSASGRRWLWVGGAAVALAAGVWIARPRASALPQRVERVEYAPRRGPLAFPGRVQAAPASVRELYEFAAHRPDVLRYLPCFCGCTNAGHRSNYDCFIDEVRPDGTVLIDDMSFT